MELAKIRNLSDDELRHQEKTSAEQLFRLRFQVSLGQNDGVKKLRQLRKEIAQIKTVARERELGIRGESQDAKPGPAVEAKPVKAEEPAPVVEDQGAEDGEESRCEDRGQDQDSESEGDRQMTATEKTAAAAPTAAPLRGAMRRSARWFPPRCRRPSWSRWRCARPMPSTRGSCASTKKFYAHDEQSSARHGRRGAHPRDASAEQAEAVVARRDCAAVGAGPD